MRRGFRFFFFRFALLAIASLLSIGHGNTPLLRLKHYSTKPAGLAPLIGAGARRPCRGRRASTSCGDAAALAHPQQMAAIHTFAARPRIAGGEEGMAAVVAFAQPDGVPLLEMPAVPMAWSR